MFSFGWTDPLTFSLLYISTCNLTFDLGATTGELSKLSISVIQAAKVKTAVERENKMAADCFPKELAWPDPLEPSHLLNG